MRYKTITLKKIITWNSKFCFFVLLVSRVSVRFLSLAWISRSLDLLTSRDCIADEWAVSASFNLAFFGATTFATLEVETLNIFWVY